jgi:3-oxoacyl-[acyl-carrier-protein] synthase-3
MTGMKAGQHSTISGARIAGIVSCVPTATVSNEHFRPAFGDKVDEIAKMTGVSERRWAAEGQTTADLCQAAAGRLLDRLGWAPDSVDGLIFISQTPDYRLPATGCALQGRLGLRPGTIAFDVNLGCSGYPYGLWLAMMMISGGSARRILLAVGDTISKTVDPDDRATAMVFGDAGTVTALEASDDGAAPAYFILGSDGAGENHLIIPSGGYKQAPEAIGRFEGRKLDSLYMDGGEIFNFTLKAVPKLIEETIELSGSPSEAFDSFLLHQANAFMIKHLTKKARLPAEKVPINIERFGNTSSATIPLLMTSDLAETLSKRSALLGLFGFGVGYSWASAAIHVGPLECVETIEA